MFLSNSVVVALAEPAAVVQMSICPVGYAVVAFAFASKIATIAAKKGPQCGPFHPSLRFIGLPPSEGFGVRPLAGQSDQVQPLARIMA